MADRVGQQFGNYRLLRLLGRGGFAEVYLGEHVYLKSQAAIKLLHANLSGQEMQDFLAEAQTIVRLDHPHIVRVLEFGVEQGQPFLVLQYAPNGTLRQRHPKGTQLPLATVLDYARQVGDALQYAHTQRLVHRDVKPENMLLNADNKVLLTDFGIAAQLQTAHTHINKAAQGTAYYMAPEQLQDQARPASDQYALGIIIYEWLSGAPPFVGSFNEVAGKHLLATPPALRTKVPTLPPAVEQVVMTALAKDPKARFASVQAFVNALQQASSMTPPLAYPSAPATLATQPGAPTGLTQQPTSPETTWPSAPTQITSQQPGSPEVSWHFAQTQVTPPRPGQPPAPAAPAVSPPSWATPPAWAQAQPASPMTLAPTFGDLVRQPPAPATPQPPPPKARQHWVRWLLAGVLLLVLASGGLLGLKLAGKGPFATASATATRTAPTATATATTVPKPALGTIKEFALPNAKSIPNAIIEGPDRNLWFTEEDANQIGRITPDGTFTEFAVPTANSRPYGITAGPDNNLWFTELSGQKIGQITPAGSITEFPSQHSPEAITTGPDGNLWFTEYNSAHIGRITPTGTITEFPLPIADDAEGITTGPDGNLWFTQAGNNHVGRSTSGGSVSEFPATTVGSRPNGIITGPDGNLWFTEWGSKQIARITPGGAVTEFGPLTGSFPDSITTGPDGNLWFTEYQGNRLGRITPAGTISEYAVPTTNSQLDGITVGPDGNLWFTEANGNKIGWISPGP